MALAGVIVPSLVGGELNTRTGIPGDISPLYPYTTSTTAPVRHWDPVVMTSGLIGRATPSTTAIIGFAFTPSVRATSPQIGQLPYQIDPTTGDKMLQAYLASQENTFRGAIQYGTPLAQSMCFQTDCDLAYAIAGPTSTVTTGGTSGATSRAYTITAINWVGESTVGSTTTLTTGNATLSATNYDIVTIPQTNGAINFGIYVAAAQVAVVAANPTGNTVYNNVGVAGSGAAAPSVNGTGFTINTAASSVGLIKIISLYDAVGSYSDAAQNPNTAQEGGRVLFQIVQSKSQLYS